MSNKILFFSAVFLIASAILYSIVPEKRRYLVLLASSLICVCLFSGTAGIFLFVTIFTAYISGIIMDRITEKNSTKGLDKELKKRIKAKVKKKKQIIVCCFAAVNLGILFSLKYFNWFFSAASALFAGRGGNCSSFFIKTAVPIGISYYTLQSLSYVIDVYRGKYAAEKNIFRLALFISFFPQLHEGPFGRYDALAPQLCAGKKITAGSVYSGASEILWGLFKIFMIANRAASISDAVFSGYKSYGGLTVLLGAVAFTVQLYAEFSGFIDVSRGISRVFSIELAENFNMPFIAENIADFWRRWHISLGAFFRDYIFYSCSASKGLRRLTKKMKPRSAEFISLFLPLLAVWFLTGLWHGASAKYIAYGFYYFILIVAANLIAPYSSRLLKKLNIGGGAIKILRIIKTDVLILIGMLMFRAENLQVFLSMLLSVFKTGKPFSLFDAIGGKDFAALILSLAVVLISAGLSIKGIDIKKSFSLLPSYKKYAVCFTAFCIIMIFGAYGLAYMPPDPIYGGF